MLSPAQRQIPHALLTRSLLIQSVQVPSFSAQLACIRHAASVRPEPGSNSHIHMSKHFCLLVCLDLFFYKLTSFGFFIQVPLLA